MPGGVAGDVIRATVAGDRMRTPPRRAAAEQHAAEARQVRRRAEQPRVSGDAAHPPRGRIVHDAAQERRVGARARPRERIGTARSARCAAAATPAAGTSCPSCRADRRRARAAYRSSRSPLTRSHDVAEQKEVDVAVDEPLARRRRRHFARSRARIASSAPLNSTVELEIGPQARRVRQQMTDRDAALAVLAELGNERAPPDRSAGCAPPRPAASRSSSSPRPW